VPSRFVLVIADDFDAGARALVGRLGAQAVLITPRCLSLPGWTWVADPWSRTGTTSKIRFKVRDVIAVVTRLAGVFPAHLPHVVQQDRDYVAAEMTAFLRAWLTGLPCRVYNRPTDMCLTGPAWNREQWAMLANRLHIPVVPTLRHVPIRQLAEPEQASVESRQTCQVVIAGPHVVCSDRCAPILAQRAEMIAKAARTPLLAVEFDRSDPSGRLLNANCWPDLTQSAVLDALTASLAASCCTALT
jgi:hypothetical protein